MTDKLRKEVERGMQARSLLEQMLEFSIEYRAGLIGKWEVEREPVERDLLWHRNRSMLDFERHLKRIVSDGRDAERRLKEVEYG